MARNSILPAVQFARALEAAGVVSDLDSIQRIVIDVDPHDLVKVYVERVAGPELKDVAGLLGEMMRDGRAVSPDAPKGVRYWVTMADELLDGPEMERSFREAGLAVVKVGGRVDRYSRMVQVEDAGASPELEGRLVELTFQRAGDGPVEVAERRESDHYPGWFAAATGAGDA